MQALLLILGFVARLILTWLVTELTRNMISGLMFGVVEHRFSRGLPALARPAVEANSRALCRAAHMRAAKWSIPTCLAGTIFTRLLFWDSGNFALRSIAPPIVLGVVVGIPIGVRAFRRNLHAQFGETRLASSRPPRDEASARAMLKSGIPWTARVVEQTRKSASLRQRVTRAVQLWDTLEQLGGDAAVSLDDLLRPDELQRRLSDPAEGLKRGLQRLSTGGVRCNR
jgi:hypothetical protein